MEKEAKVDRRRDVNKILKSGQGWTLAAEDRKKLKWGVVTLSVVPNDLARLWDRLR